MELEGFRGRLTATLLYLRPSTGASPLHTLSVFCVFVPFVANRLLWLISGWVVERGLTTDN